MNTIIDFIIKRYKLMAVLIFLITIPFGYYYLMQTTLNHIDIFFEQDDPGLTYYKRFQKMYGNEEVGVIVFKDADIFTRENIEVIREISEIAKNTKGVQRVASLTESTVSVANKDSVSFEKVVPEGEITEELLETGRQRALHHDVIKQSIISDDGTTTAIMIELEPLSSNEKKREILTYLKNTANKIAHGRVGLHFTGAPYVEVEINDLTRRDNYRFIPITLILIFFGVAFLLKKMSLSILAEWNIALVGTWGIGMLVLCGEKMNMVTVIIPPILLAIAVADSIHILSHYRELHVNKGLDHVSAVSQSIKSLWLPCLFTSLTTGIGFFSFITTTVRPVKVVGIFTSIGVLYAFILTCSFLPVAMIIFRKWIESKNKVQGASMPESQSKDNEGATFFRLLMATGNFTIKYYRPICVISIIIIILAAVGMFKLRYETNFANYLPESNNIKKDINFIEKNMGGSVPVVILFRAKSPEHDFTHPESLVLLSKIQNQYMGLMQGHYTWSFSIADYFKELNMAYTSGTKKDYVLPDKRMDILDYYELSDANDLARIVSPDRMEARVSFMAHLSSSQEARERSNRAYPKIKKMLGENFTYRYTGSGPLYSDMEVNLKDSQVRSFFSAFICILIMMFFLCRDLRLTLISMIPNMFPIVLTLGIMGWLGIPLDVSTIMIASVTIGIAVDDTIHYLTWYRRNLKAGMETRPALLKTYKDTGKPIVITSVVLCTTYLILTTGSIKPVIAFGILASLAMFFALIGDLLIFPAFLILGGKKRKNG